MTGDSYPPDGGATAITQGASPSDNMAETTYQGADGETVIREARLEDVQPIVRVYLDGFEASWGCASTRTFESYMAVFQSRVMAPLGHSRIWVATARGEVIGWQALQDLGFLAQSSTYVDSRWRTAGIGRRLLAHAQKQAKSLGFTHILGNVRKDNVSSIRMVESLGWQLLGPLPRYSPTSPEYVYYVHTVMDISEGDCG